MTSEWTDDLRVALPPGTRLEAVVDFIIESLLARTPDELTEHQTAEKFGISHEDAALLRDRVCGGIIRGAMSTAGNQPSRHKDPAAWLAFQRTAANPAIFPALYPGLHARSNAMAELQKLTTKSGLPTVVACATNLLSLKHSDARVFDLLVERGFSHEMVAKLVLFIPVAWARKMLEPLKIDFPERFQLEGLEAAPSTGTLSAEVIYREASSLAQSRAGEGWGADYCLAVSSRSPEFERIRRVLEEKGDPKGLDWSLLTLVVTWDVAPDSTGMFASLLPRKPWWKFW